MTLSSSISASARRSDGDGSLRTIARKLFKSVLGLLALVLVLVAGLIGYAQTEGGQDRIASLLTDLLSTPEQRIELSGLRGAVPFDLRLAHVRLADPQGAWLEAEDVRLAITARNLLRGAVTIREVGAARVALHRLPPPGPPAPPSNEPFSLPELPELPASLPVAAVERLHVDRLELGAPVLGTPAVFNLEGHAGTAPEGSAAELELALRRLDAPTAEARVAARLDLPARSLTLDVTGSETGGLLAKITKRPEAGDLRLALRGQGPLSGWRGRLDATAEGLATAGLDLDLAYDAEKRLGLAGGIELAPGLLPPELAAPVGRRVDLELAGHATGPQQVRLERLEVRTASAAITGTADADLAADAVTAKLDLDVPDLAPLSGVAQVPLAGRTHATLTADGPVNQPKLRLALDGGGITAASAALRELAATVDVALLAPLGQGEPAMRVTATTRVRGLALDGRELGPDGRLDLDLAASLPETGRAAIERLELRSPLATLTGKGEVDRASLEGGGRVDLSVPDLASVMAAFAPDVMPGEVGGAFGLGADLDVAAAAKSIEIGLDGGGHGLRLPENLLPLIGPTPTIAGAATVRPGESVVTRFLTIAGAAFRLDADPRLGLADQALGGGLHLAVPDLAPLATLAGGPVAGKVDLSATLAGAVPAPDLKLDLAARRLSVAGQEFARIDLAASAAGELAAPKGSVRLEAERAGAVAALATRYALKGQKLSLTDLALEAPATRLAGAVDVALDGPRATGRLAGAASNLAALAPLIGQPLTGAVDLDLRLATPEGRQDADLTVAAREVAGSFGRLDAARLEAGVRDALGTMRLDADLAADRFAAPGVTVSRTTLTAAGPLSALALRLATAGEQAGKPFDLRTAATVDAASATRTVRLESLEAGYAGETARLLQPATARLGAGGAMGLDRLLLAVAGGRLTASGELAAEQVTADLSLDGLDLARLERFGAPPLQGRAAATASLRGAVGAPTARAQVTVADVALDPAMPIKPDLDFRATLARGVLSTNLELDELGEPPLTASVAVPMAFALQPFRAEVASTGRLDGRVDGSVDLARAVSLAPVQGLQVAGDLDLALGLGGTLVEPSVDGSVTLAGGSVQDLTSGIDLADLTLRIEGRGREIVLSELSARGRTGGTLRGSGNVGLQPGGGVRYAAAIDLAQLRVLNNDLGSVILSTDIDAQGDAAGARVGGRVTVDSADIAIPEGGGPSVPVMQVEEVNAAPGEVQNEPKPPAGPPFDLALDLAIDVPARLFIRGRGLDSEWGGNLTVRGQATAPEIVGELEFRRGFLDLLEKRFEIRRGIISFVGSQPPIPMIDLEASVPAEEITALIRVKGPATKPEIELSSEPVLPQDEILARILFGRSVTQLTPVQGLRLASAVSTLQGGSGTADVLSSLRKGLGVDTLDVGGTGTEDASAKAGKYVSDKVFVEVERGVQTGSGKARVQVELTPNLSVNTEVDEQSQTGVGLEWRFDY